MSEGVYKMVPPLMTPSLRKKMREVVLVIKIKMSEGGYKIQLVGVVGKPMVEAGVAVFVSVAYQSRAQMHQKTAVIDGQVAYLGSGNGTNYSRRHSYEVGVIITNPGMVSALADRYRTLEARGEALTLEAAQARAAQARAQRPRTRSSSPAPPDHLAGW